MMVRTKQTTQNWPPSLIQLQAAKGFNVVNSGANAGIQPPEPVAKMDAGQDSSSSDNKQEEAQDDDQKSNDNKQEEAPDDNEKSDKKDDDDNKNPVDDANEDDDNAEAAKQTDNDNSADVVLKIIDIDINDDTGKVGRTDGSIDDSKGGNAESAESNTEAGQDNVEAAETPTRRQRQ
jgi:hypothetical protein